MNYDFILTAGDYISSGLSVTLTDDRKASIGPWKDFQSRYITDDELHLKAPYAKGLAIICGKVSGNLEVVDIDLKYDLSGDLFQRLKSIIPDIFSKLTVAKTVSDGYHLYYRCQTIDQNLKLARRPSTPQETAKNPHIKVLVLIETRGEGGYVVAPPSAGYQWIQGSYKTIPTLTVEERDTLLSACRSLNQYLEESKVTQIEISPDYGHSPIDDYNKRGDVLALLQKHGWKTLYERNGRTYLRRPGKDEGQSGDFWHEKRWFSVFTTSSQFEPNTAYTPSAVYCMLEMGNNWTKTVQTLAKEGYGENLGIRAQRMALNMNISKMKANGRSEGQIIMQIHKERGISFDAAKELYDKAIQLDVDPDQFWEEDAKGKITINYAGIHDFLGRRGYYIIPNDDNGNNTTIVRMVDNIVEQTSIEKIKRELKEFTQLKDPRVTEWLAKNYHLINESFLHMLPKIGQNFLRDDRNCAYFPFINGIVKVTADEITLIEHHQIPKFIWKSALIDHEIEIYPETNGMNINILEGKDTFQDFVHLISGEDHDRFFGAVSIIGYMLHEYKDPTRPYAVCLCEETDDEAKGGGTGKGIFITAINYLKKTEQIDGKNLKLDKSFLWQRIGLDTRIIALQDVRRFFDFEGIYSFITEGLSIEKKGKQEISIPFERSPKFIMTTNFMIPDTSNHARRRLKILPFSPFFSPERTPHDYFGEQLFHDWDKAKWSTFYNFMFACSQYYLKNGVIDIVRSESMLMKTVATASGDEFRNWLREFRLSNPQPMPFKEVYSKFLLETDIEEKDYSKKKFKKALLQAAAILGDKVIESNKGPAGGRLLHYHVGPINKTEVKLTDPKTFQLIKNGEIESKSNTLTD